MRLIDFVFNGGPFAWPLCVFFVLGFICFIERVVFLHKGQIRAESFVNGIKNLLKKGRKLEALTLCQETPGPVANIVRVSLLYSDLEEKELMMQIKKNALLELPILEKRVNTIRFLGQISPLFGLMGTVFAFLKAFYEMTTFGEYASVLSYSPFVISALTVSFLGLLLSALSYLAFHFLKGRVRAIIFDIEWTAIEMVSWLSIEYSKENKK